MAMFRLHTVFLFKMLFSWLMGNFIGLLALSWLGAKLNSILEIRIKIMPGNERGCNVLALQCSEYLSALWTLFYNSSSRINPDWRTVYIFDEYTIYHERNQGKCNIFTSYSVFCCLKKIFRFLNMLNLKGLQCSVV